MHAVGRDLREKSTCIVILGLCVNKYINFLTPPYVTEREHRTLSLRHKIINIFYF